MADSLYVSDYNNGRLVQRNLNDLSFISQLTQFTGVSYGTQEYFSANVGITINGSYIFTVDVYDNSVIKLNLSDYSIVSKAGTFGTGDDNFSSPLGITNDGTYLYICDIGNSRIVKRLMSDLSYVAQTAVTAYACTADGTYLYICDQNFGSAKIVKLLASDFSFVDEIGSFGSGNDQFSNPLGITNDGTCLYVVDQWNYRIVKRLMSDLSYVSQIGSFGSGNDNFNNPYGIATDGTYIYITDKQNFRVVKRLASDLSYVSQVGSFGFGDNTFSDLYEIAADGAAVYICDGGYSRIVKRLSSDFSLISQVDSYENPALGDYFFSPKGIASDSAYVYFFNDNDSSIIKCTNADLLSNSDFLMNRAIVFDGTEIVSFGSDGTISADETHLYVSTGSRVYKLLSSDLSYVSASPLTFNGGDSFSSLVGISVDSTHIYIGDVISANNGRIIKMLKSNFSYVSESVTPSSTPFSNTNNSGILYCTDQVINI